MALKKASLACTVCGSRNYSINLSSNPKPTRLEVNKFCKHCGQYTIHKETR
ncbi:TPA: 50S ribosomal protein L33 [Streptococcus suis]